jgi:hypothetical protein
MHTHTHTHTHTHDRARARIFAHTHVVAHTHTQTHTHTDTHTHTLTHSHTYVRTHTHARAHTHTHARTHTRTSTRTHTHTNRQLQHAHSLARSRKTTIIITETNIVLTSAIITTSDERCGASTAMLDRVYGSTLSNYLAAVGRVQVGEAAVDDSVASRIASWGDGMTDADFDSIVSASPPLVLCHQPCPSVHRVNSSCFLVPHRPPALPSPLSSLSFTSYITCLYVIMFALLGSIECTFTSCPLFTPCLLPSLRMPQSLLSLHHIVSSVLCICSTHFLRCAHPPPISRQPILAFTVQHVSVTALRRSVPVLTTDPC